MHLFKNKNRTPDPENDRVAQFIAGQIIRWQRRTSNWVNHWINGYSRKKQRLVLILSGILVTGLLIISLIRGIWQIPLHANRNYIPPHIGEPSDTLRLKEPGNKITDSLTSKK